MAQVTHRRSPDEPEGGWLGPSGPGDWPDLQELDRKQRSQKPQAKRPWEK